MNEEQYSKYEDDIENGDYEKYLGIIPSDKILGTMTCLALYQVDKSVIDKLISYGLNVNKRGDYCSDLNISLRPIFSACEFRRYPAIQGLLENGASLEKYQGCSPVEFVLQGHSFGDVDVLYKDIVEECIKLLVSYGVSLEIRNDLFGPDSMDNCNIRNYKSDYLDNLNWIFY